MARVILCILLLNAYLLAEEKKINSTNSEWFTLQGSLNSSGLPKGEWKKTDFKAIIIPEYKGRAPQLKNFELPLRAFPRMLTVATGPPSSGIFRIEENEISRYNEFIDEVAFETDNNIELFVARYVSRYNINFVNS